MSVNVNLPPLSVSIGAMGTGGTAGGGGAPVLFGDGVGTGGTWNNSSEFPAPVLLLLVDVLNSLGRDSVTRAPTTGSFVPARSTTPSMRALAACCTGEGACANASAAKTRRGSVSYTHLRAHETPEHLVCR